MAKVVGQRPRYEPLARQPAVIKHPSTAHRPVELLTRPAVRGAMDAGALAGRVLTIAELMA